MVNHHFPFTRNGYELLASGCLRNQGCLNHCWNPGPGQCRDLPTCFGEMSGDDTKTVIQKTVITKSQSCSMNHVYPSLEFLGFHKSLHRSIGDVSSRSLAVKIAGAFEMIRRETDPKAPEA